MSNVTEETKNRFIGRILLLNTIKRSYQGMNFIEYELADPVFEGEMVELGFSNYRLHLPGTMSTSDFVEGRFNVVVERDGRIADVFFG